MKGALFLLLIIVVTCHDLVAETSDSIPSVMLNEVVVKEYKKYVRTEGPQTIISISGSPFGGFQDFDTMLENLPGMSPSGAGPIVIGGGIPKYFVNGREIKELNELKAIQPSNVKTIEINRIPGAEYSSNGQPVVLITLKKSLDDYVYLNVGASTSVKRNFGAGLNLNFRYQYKKFSTSLFANEATDKSELKETYSRIIYHPDYTSITSQYRDVPNRTTGTILRYIAEYRFTNKSFIGLYYNFTHLTSTPKPFGINTINSPLDVEKWDYSSNGKNINNIHNFTIMWDWGNDKIYLRLTQDAFFRFSPGHASTLETPFDNTESVKTESNTHAKYSAYTTNAKIWLNQLPWNLSAATGARYDHVNSNTTSHIDTELFTYNSLMKSNEDDVSLFISLSKRFGKFLLRPDLNYTYTHRSITNNVQADSPYTVKQDYSTFTPRVYLQWTPNNLWSVYALYQRQITQPGFSALNSGLIYKNQWEWEDGNPDLRAITTNEYTFGGSWNSLAGKVSYYDTRNYISQWENLLNSETDAISSLFVNIPSYKAWSAELSYSNRIRKFNYYAAVNAIFPNYKMLVKGESIHRKHANFFANVNLSYTLDSHFSFTTSYTWSGASYDVPLVYRHSWQKWNVGVQASLLNQRLSISLNIEDILNTANYSNNISWYNNISRSVNGTSDSRGIILRIAYTFFNKKINTYTESGNSELRYRIN